MARRATRVLALCAYLASVVFPAAAQPVRSVAPASPPAATGAPPAPAVEPAEAGVRLALVIGNEAYKSAGALRNPVNDAKAVAAVLREQGFEVMYLENLGVGDFRRAIRDFTQRAQAEEGVAFFYYAGHAVSIDGRNYLLPTDVKPTDADAVSDDSIDVDTAILSRLDKSKKRFKIVVLDSCRNNPFLQANARNVRSGLSGMGSAGGTLIAFSTAPGRVAEDGTGVNSTFTAHLVKELRDGGEIEQVFKRVRIAVNRITGGKQEPWVNASLTSDLYLRPGKQAPAAALPAPAGIDEEQQRILANIEVAERKREAERQRQYDERQRDKARIEGLYATLSDALQRERLAREALEQQQQRQLAELTTRLTGLQQVISETQQAGRGRPLTPDESNRITVALADTEALKQKAASDAGALQAQLAAAREREAERIGELTQLAAQAARLNEPIAPQRPRVAADGTIYVRGVSLPKDARIDPAPADAPAACTAFQGAWQGRWDGARTVELWVQRVERDCSATLVYGRGGQSTNAEAPRHARVQGKIVSGELRATLDDGAVLRVRQKGERQLDATWSRDGRTVRAELARIADDPMAGTVTFADEERDFGARPARYLQVPRAANPLPLTVPGVTTITTLELKDKLDRDPSVVLVDAYSENDHMTLPGAYWRPDIGVVRPGAFPLAEMTRMMEEITGRDRDRPVVVFERSAHWGWYGYNAALRLVGMGYTNVFWYRGGIDAWFDAGYQMTKVSARRVAAQ